MAAALVLARGPELFLVAADPSRGPRGWEGAGPDAEGIPLPSELLTALAASGDVRAGDSATAAALTAALRRSVVVAGVTEVRRARARLPDLSPADERAFLMARARSSLARALASPIEVLITLAREEERVERALGRDDRAIEALMVGETSVLRQYRNSWGALREQLAHHHGRLLTTLERSTRALVPNLAAIVGERVAARLVAAAGGVAPLGRMRAARLQLLGSRRRPSPDRGPRYGILYRGSRMTDVPAARRAAYARSLAALAAIAVRADATTHRDLSVELVARRDRRVESLRRGRR